MSPYPTFSFVDGLWASLTAHDRRCNNGVLQIIFTLWWWFLNKYQRVHPFHSPSSLYHHHHRTLRDHPLMDINPRYFIWDFKSSSLPPKWNSDWVACLSVLQLTCITHLVFEQHVSAQTPSITQTLSTNMTATYLFQRRHSIRMNCPQMLSQINSVGKCQLASSTLWSWQYTCIIHVLLGCYKMNWLTMNCTELQWNQKLCEVTFMQISPQLFITCL